MFTSLILLNKYSVDFRLSIVNSWKEGGPADDSSLRAPSLCM